MSFNVSSRARRESAVLCSSERERVESGPWVVLVVGALLCSSILVSAQTPHTFVQKYCIDCHGEKRQKGDRRFDQLEAGVIQIGQLESWQEILDQINRGSMPPEDAKQPSPEERVAIARRLTGQLSEAVSRLAPSDSATTLRRLNRYEYDRSVRDLLNLKMLADPTGEFPPDEAEHNFRNIGASLVLSDFLLARYLKASDVYLRHATHPEQKPVATKRVFNAPYCNIGNRLDGLDKRGHYQHLRKNHHDQGGFLGISQFRRGVPHAGNYRIRISATAIGRNYPYPEKRLKVPKADPLRLGVVATIAGDSDLTALHSTDVRLTEFELADDEQRWYEFTTWLDKGYQPRVFFPNGPISVKAHRSELVRSYPEKFNGYITKHVPKYNVMHPEYDPRTKDKLIAEFFARQKDRRNRDGGHEYSLTHSINVSSAWARFYREYEGPRIRIHEIQVEGPFYDQWPPASHQRLFGKGELTDHKVRQLLADFADRAFRRPASRANVDSLFAVYDRERKQGLVERDALHVAYQTILCSPNFLYLHQSPSELDQHDLASRLSYFLWSTPPDAKLAAAASRGELDETGLVRHADRMRRDPKAQAFVERFTEAWLGLGKLGTMLPSQTAHPEYFNQNLEEAMRKETHLFIADAIKHDRPLADFLVGDQTFVNGPLARLYGIDGVSGNAFQRVALNDNRRGGLLGMASILTATANGIETSPIVRGVWVLENILGTPPPAPPPDIEPIEPDIRGAKTIREQLAKHRTVATCRSCHAQIDPIGFALESFDEVGNFRRHYVRRNAPRSRRYLPIDPSGELPTGEKFRDITELKQLLFERQDLFTANLASKLLTYATGRMPSVADRLETDRIAKEHQGGFRSLIQAIITSDSFSR